MLKQNKNKNAKAQKQKICINILTCVGKGNYLLEDPKALSTNKVN